MSDRIVSASQETRRTSREWAIVTAILLLGLICRMVLAFTRVDLIWPDEHFQTLEPAGKIVFGHAFESWEWIKGYRTWLLPLFFVPPLLFAKALGIESGLELLHLSRAYVAWVDSVAWALFYITLRKFALGNLTRYLLLGFVAISPASLLWGVATLQDHVAMILLIFALGFSLKASALTPSARNSITAGFLWGIPGWYKLQTGLFSVGFVLTQATLALRARENFSATLRRALAVFLGGGLALLCIGLSDWITWGQFAGSILNQIRNGESISRFYGVSPWTDGFKKLFELVDPFFWFTLGLGLIGLVFERNRPKLSLKSALPPLIGLTFFLVFHFAIPHKEVRFFLPMLPFLVLSWGFAWDAPLRSLERSIRNTVARLSRTWERVLPSLLIAIMIGSCAGWSITTALGRPLYLTSVDSSELEDQIGKMKELILEDQEVCIILGGHNWSWARGALIVGAPVHYFEIKAEEFSSRDLPQKCHVALVDGNHSEAFERAYPAFRMALLGKNRFHLWIRAERFKEIPISDPSAHSTR
jgi:hypothetical protein